MSDKNYLKFEQKEGLISNDFIYNMHDEIHPIINLINPFPDIFGSNFLEELFIYNPYPEMDRQTFYFDSITDQFKFGKPPPSSLPPE
jgi:hypothetical protein